MSRQLMEIVLPRLARPLAKHLERYNSGELNDLQFTKRFEALLRRQHAWLSQRGISDARAAVTIHAALLILSKSGLRAEAEELHIPLEVIEFRAVREAAADVVRNYGVNEAKVIRAICNMLARYGD